MSIDHVSARKVFHHNEDTSKHVFPDQKLVIEGLSKLLKAGPSTPLRGTTTIRLSVGISTAHLMELLGKGGFH